MRKLYVFDTTLRDGEQSLGITLNIREKLEISSRPVSPPLRREILSPSNV